MRNEFAAWYPFTPEERATFITDGLVVLDTNVLLDLYRTTIAARDDLISLLERLDDRLWIPHQVGLEFQKNRLSVIFEQEQVDTKLRTALADASSKLHEVARNLRDHPAIDKRKFLESVDRGLQIATSYLDSAASVPFPSVKAAMNSDPVLDAVTKLFEGKVGSPYDDNQLKSVHAEAKRRIEQRLPPGYADSKKGQDQAYGDYTLWRQTLDEATKRKLPVLFVTNDQKEDWYRRVHGVTVGPRVELTLEMAEVAGVTFHSQTLARFVETAPIYLNSKIQGDTVVEVSKLDEVARSREMPDASTEFGIANPTSISVSPPPKRSAEVGASPEYGSLLRRHDRLQERVSQLRRDLARVGPDNNVGAPEDPRSFRRAIEVRIEVAEQALEELTKEISDARSITDSRQP